MFPTIKLFLFSYLFVISVIVCASKSIDNGTESDLRIFIYENLPYFRYSNGSSLSDPKILWTNQTNMITLEYYPEEKTFFWTTDKGELYSMIWNEDGDITLEEFNKTDKNIFRKKENAKLLYREEDWYPRSIALDEIGKKLYIVDTTERSVDVFDLDGKNKATIFTTEYLIPMEIAIDPNEGLLFLYGFNFQKNKFELYRMNMDGSDHRLIIFNIDTDDSFFLDERKVFAIDRVNKKLYYKGDSPDTVMVDYNGYGKIPILTENGLLQIQIYSNRIYWLKRFSRKNLEFLENVHKKQSLLKTPWKVQHILYSCDISDIKTFVNTSILCSPEKVNESLKFIYWLPKLSNFPKLFKIVDLSPQKKLTNPCLENNGGCEDHCLLKPSGADKKLSFGCACRVGRKLNDDERTCSDITRADKLVNEYDTFVYDKVWIPKEYFFSTRIFNIFQEHLLNWNYPITKTFVKKLFYDGPEVARDDYLNEKYEVNTKGELVKCQSDSKCITLRNSTEKIAKFLAYDWVSQNLYYAKSCNISGKYNLFVLTAKYPEKEIFLGQIDTLTSMIVHPYIGYLFVATYDETKNESHIVRFNTDGKDRIVLPYSDKTHILITVDMEENVIYWIDGSDWAEYKCLRRSDFDGGDLKLIANEKFSVKLQHIKVFRNYIILKAPPDMNTIFSISNVGEDWDDDYVEHLENSFKSYKVVTKLKVKKTDTQYFSLENPCVLNNGGCEMFCFAVPVDDSEEVQKVCGCSNEKRLDSNGLNCV